MTQADAVDLAVSGHLGVQSVLHKSGYMSDRWYRFVYPLAAPLDEQEKAVLTDLIKDCGPVNVVIYHGSDLRRKRKYDCIITFQEYA